jgi:hypothetical protein
MIGLAYSIKRAGDALTSSSDRITSLLVAEATPLLAICAEVYGAGQAEEMADKIARSNRIRTPGLVPAGSKLSIPLPRAA